eukprot:1901080-Rhodomonas_salina.4
MSTICTSSNRGRAIGMKYTCTRTGRTKSYPGMSIIVCSLFYSFPRLVRRRGVGHTGDQATASDGHGLRVRRRLGARRRAPGQAAESPGDGRVGRPCQMAAELAGRLLSARSCLNRCSTLSFPPSLCRNPSPPTATAFTPSSAHTEASSCSASFSSACPDAA